MENGFCSHDWPAGGRKELQPARFSASCTQFPHPQTWQLLDRFSESISPVSPDAPVGHHATQPLVQDDRVLLAEKNVGDSEDEMLASSRLEGSSPNHSRPNLSGSSSHGHNSGTMGSFEDIRSPASGASSSQPDINTSFHSFHLRSPRVDTNDSDSSNASQEPRSPSELGNASTSKGTTTSRKKGQQYFPNYMNGVELCMVCGDVSTGFHYRTMTCEGCKGFFRRTNQKKLEYQCKYNKNCVINKNTRNQCQDCRYRKCIQVGMAADLVLDEPQRLAKRQLIEKNRQLRQIQQAKRSRTDTSDKMSCQDELTASDTSLIATVLASFITLTSNQVSPEAECGEEVFGQDEWSNVPSKMKGIAPALTNVITFAQSLPGFTSLTLGDKRLMLWNCCLEVMILQAASRYDRVSKALTLKSGQIMQFDQEKSAAMTQLQHLFEKLSALELDQTEFALIAALLIMQSDWTGLEGVEAIDQHQDDILTAFRRHVSHNHPDQPLRWPRILMMVTDIRDMRVRHLEDLLYQPLDEDGEATSSLYPLLA